MLNMKHVVTVILLLVLIISTCWYCHSNVHKSNRLNVHKTTIEPFVDRTCKYLHKQKRTPLGTFMHTNTDDSTTCKTLHTQFGTPYNYLQNKNNGSVWCEDDNMKVAYNEKVQVYPNPGCIFHTPIYDTTCGQLAEKFNTTIEPDKNTIEYKTDKHNTSPPQKCSSPTEKIQHNTLTQICRNTTNEHRARMPRNKSDACLNPGCLTTLGDCKRSCTQTENCKSIMYGAGNCRLYDRIVPLQNIDEETNNENMYACSLLEPLRYAGATNALFDEAPSCSSSGECETLGATGCNQNCIPPYTNNIPYTDASIENAWTTIIEANTANTSHKLENLKTAKPTSSINNEILKLSQEDNVVSTEDLKMFYTNMFV